MAVSPALKRLLRIRDLEEEQSRIALESAMGELRALENALAASHELGRRGRRLVGRSAQTGELPDRMAGMEEGHAAARFAEALTPRIANEQQTVAQRRQEYMNKRLERRQAETLIEESAAQQAIEDGRRSQQMLDDWYSGRQYRLEMREELSKSSLPATDGEAGLSGLADSDSSAADSVGKSGENLSQNIADQGYRS